MCLKLNGKSFVKRKWIFTLVLAFNQRNQRWKITKFYIFQLLLFNNGYLMWLKFNTKNELEQRARFNFLYILRMHVCKCVSIGVSAFVHLHIMTIQFKIDDDGIDLSLNIATPFIWEHWNWFELLHYSKACCAFTPLNVHTHTHTDAQPYDGDNRETDNEKVLGEKCVAPNFVML